jgi:hypothetical protein
MAALSVCFRLRRLPGSSPLRPAESSSSSYGPPVRFRLLPTPPHDDAVTFSYEVMAYPDADFHRAVYAPSRAHWEPGLRAKEAHSVSGAALPLPGGLCPPSPLWEPGLRAKEAHSVSGAALLLPGGLCPPSPRDAAPTGSFHGLPHPSSLIPHPSPGDGRTWKIRSNKKTLGMFIPLM